METKTRQQADQLFSIVDAVINGVNDAQHRAGTGRSFSYNLMIIPPSKKDKDASTQYNFTIKMREAAYGETELQTIPFTKPDNYDRYKMEVQVLLSVLTIITEITFTHWVELGKMLNVDTELQEAAKKA
tara:strand:+ start:473 stop:859 length:387 start_codon:yes stop_codon:yes gene_type:complete